MAPKGSSVFHQPKDALALAPGHLFGALLSQLSLSELRCQLPSVASLYFPVKMDQMLTPSSQGGEGGQGGNGRPVSHDTHIVSPKFLPFIPVTTLRLTVSSPVDFNYLVSAQLAPFYLSGLATCLCSFFSLPSCGTYNSPFTALSTSPYEE